MLNHFNKINTNLYNFKTAQTIKFKSREKKKI